MFPRDCGSGCGIHRCIWRRRRDLEWRHGCVHLTMGGTITTDAARNSLLFLLLLLLFGMLVHATNMAAAAPITASSPSPGVSICMREGCNCTNTPPHWLIVTCSFSSKQASGYLPNVIARRTTKTNAICLLQQTPVIFWYGITWVPPQL